MIDTHNCFGVQASEDKVAVCSCVSPSMYSLLENHFRAEFISEVNAFASEYHHHIDGQDVVIVEHLIAFLLPIQEVTDGLGTTG